MIDLQHARKVPIKAAPFELKDRGRKRNGWKKGGPTSGWVLGQPGQKYGTPDQRFPDNDHQTAPSQAEIIWKKDRQGPR